MTDNHDPDEPFTTDGPIGEMMDDIRLRGPKAMFRDHQIEQASPLGQPAKDFVGAVQQYARLVHEAIAEEGDARRDLAERLGNIERRVIGAESDYIRHSGEIERQDKRLDDHENRVRSLETSVMGLERREVRGVEAEFVELRQRLDRLANRMAEIDARVSKANNRAAEISPADIRRARGIANTAFTVAYFAIAMNIAFVIWFLTS